LIYIDYILLYSVRLYHEIWGLVDISQPLQQYFIYDETNQTCFTVVGAMLFF